jgi:acetyltransferase-like isoleucine patch superfamily enzyme
MSKLRGLIRLFFLYIKYVVCTKVYGMDIDPTARVSWGTVLDKTYPKGIHIGTESYIASGTLVLSHDFCRNIHTDTIIGKRCFIGAHAILMPGITIGDGSIVGSGAVVTKDVPAGCIVAGNPARILREGIQTIKYGQLAEAQPPTDHFK